MHALGPAQYLAECFWPDVKDSDLAELDARAEASTAELSRRGDDVSYLGSLLLLDDEVVLCRFEGAEDSVRRAAQKAAIPYERILKATHSPWRPEPRA
jgi:hypothetical protein